MDLNLSITLNVLLMLVIYIIFIGFTFSLPRGRFQGYSVSIKYFRQFIVSSSLLPYAYVFRAVYPEYNYSSIISITLISLISIYTLNLSIIKKVGKDFEIRTKRCAFAHAIFTLSLVIGLLWCSAPPILYQLVIVGNVSLGLGVAYFLHKRTMPKNLLGHKMLSGSIALSGLIVLVMTPVLLTLFKDDPLARFFSLCLIAFSSTAITTFGFAMSIVYSLFYQLELSGNVDKLTKVYNRNFFYDAMDLLLSKVDRENRSMCFVLADIDDFKQLNDKHGHLVGDQALYDFAQLLRSSLRKEDLVIRFGGEEFLIVLVDHQIEQAVLVVQRMLEQLATQPLLTDKNDLCVTASFGIQLYQQTKTLDENIAAADRALYKAKGQGKNTFTIASD